MVILVLSAIFVPTIASGLKSKTDMPCLRDEIIYGLLLSMVLAWLIILLIAKAVNTIHVLKL